MILADFGIVCYMGLPPFWGQYDTLRERWYGGCYVAGGWNVPFGDGRGRVRRGGGFFSGVSQGSGGWDDVHFIQGVIPPPDWGSIVTFSGDDIMDLRVLISVIQAVSFLPRLSPWLPGF